MMQTKNWMALVGLTCAAFIFNTSEFIPIGLLTDIANDFLTTEAQAGDRKSTRLNSSHLKLSRMPSSA